MMHMLGIRVRDEMLTDILNVLLKKLANESWGITRIGDKVSR